MVLQIMELSVFIYIYIIYTAEAILAGHIISFISTNYSYFIDLLIMHN